MQEHTSPCMIRAVHHGTFSIATEHTKHEELFVSTVFDIQSVPPTFIGNGSDLEASVFIL